MEDIASNAKGVTNKSIIVRVFYTLIKEGVIKIQESLRVCGIELTDNQYLEILAIMKKHNIDKITKPQLNHFKEAGWFALNTGWYNQAAQKRFMDG